MWKWIKVVTIYLPYFLYHYFVHILRMLRHKDRYSLQERYDLIRKLSAKLLKYLRVDIHAQGMYNIQNTRTQFLIVNHFSLLDALTIMTYSQKPIIFIAKEETYKMPLAGKCLKLLDGITLKRGNLRAEINSIRAMENCLKDGLTVCIFPEGTRNRSYTAPFNEFKAGSFKPGMRAKVEIVPITLIGTQFPLKMTNFKRYPICLTVGKPYLPSDYEGKSTVEFSKSVQTSMQASVNNLRIEHRKLFLPYLNKKNHKLIA